MAVADRHPPEAPIHRGPPRPTSPPESDDGIAAERDRMGSHPFLLAFREGAFSLDFARQIASMQVGYNLEVIVALTRMRRTLAHHPAFVWKFLDPLLATEFGGDLDAVGLHQQGVSHVKMIYDLTRSLGMEGAALRAWGPEASRFFDEALNGLIGGACPAAAMGALYANEVFATAWYPALFEGFQAFSNRCDTALDLVFLESHGGAIELSHVEHVVQLLNYREALGLERAAFSDGYRRFSAALERKFTALHQQLMDERGAA